MYVLGMREGGGARPVVLAISALMTTARDGVDLSLHPGTNRGTGPVIVNGHCGY